MDLQNTKAKKITSCIKDDPLDMSAWQDLTMLVFEQKETEVFRAYHLIVEGLEQLVSRRPNDTIFGPVSSPPVLGVSHKQVIMDCVMKPKDAKNIAAFSRILLEDARLPLPARRLAFYAAKIEPGKSEWDQLIEDCREANNYGIRIGQAGFDPGEAKSALIQPTKSNEVSELKELIKESVSVSPELVGEQEQKIDTPKFSSIPRVDVEQLEVTAASEPAWGAVLNKVLLAVQQESYSEILELLTINDAEEQGSNDPAFGLLYLVAGMAMHRESRQNEAADFYQEAMKRLPSVSALMFYQASAYHELWMLDESACLYEAVTGELPEHHAAWHNLSLVYQAQAKYEQSEQAAEKAVSLESESLVYQRNYAAILFANDKTQEACDLLAALVAAHSDDSDLLLHYALTLYQLGYYQLAQQHLEKRLEITGGDTEGVAYLAICFAYQAKSAQAYDLICDMEPTPDNQSLVASAWVKTAFALEKDNRQDVALTLLEKALDCDEENADAWLRKGLIFKRQDKLDEALNAFELVIKVEPYLARAWAESGMIHYSREDYIVAAEQFQHAADLDPSLPQWPFYAAVTWEKLENLDKAQEAYYQAVAVDPDHLAAHTNLALILVHRGESEQARVVMDKMVERHPESADGWFCLGCICEHQKDTDAAADAYRKSLELDPNKEEARTNLDSILDEVY